MHRGEMSEMLTSIEANGKPWLIGNMVVQRIKGMWYIFYGWTVGNSGTVIHKQPERKGLIPMIEELQEELD